MSKPLIKGTPYPRVLGDTESLSIPSGEISTSSGVINIPLSRNNTLVALEQQANVLRHSTAGAGFIEWGKVDGNLSEYAINEGMSTYDPYADADLAKGLLLGWNGPDFEGDSRTSYPILNLYGYVLKIKSSNILGKPAFFVKFPEAPNSPTLPFRIDLVFIEVWKEDVSIRDVVFPLGNVQFSAPFFDGIALSDASSLGVAQSYCAFGGWDSSTVGKAVKWSTLDTESKNKLLKNPYNNLVYDKDKLIQVRYRIRVMPNFDDNAMFQGMNDSITNIQVGSGDPEQPGAEIAYDSSLSYDGYAYATGICDVARHNTGAYHPQYNPEGTAVFSDGKAWHETTVSVSSIEDCFTNADTNSGYYSSGISGRPDEKYYDIIYEADIRDERKNTFFPTNNERITFEALEKYCTGSMRGWEPSKLMTVAKYNKGPVVDLGSSGSFDDQHIEANSVLKENNTYKMYYTALSTTDWKYKIAYATSNDGTTWSKQGIVVGLGNSGDPDAEGVGSAYVINDNGTYKMWYQGSDGSKWTICYATSTDGVNWNKQGRVLDVGPSGSYDQTHVINPCVIKDGSTYKMWYTGINNYAYNICYATSSDGINWSKQGVVLTAEDPFNLAWYPRIIYENNMYKMFFIGRTADNYRQMAYAISSDGINWTIKGAILSKNSSLYLDNNILGAFSVINDNDVYKVWYSFKDNDNYRIFYGTLLIPQEETDFKELRNQLELRDGFMITYKRRAKFLHCDTFGTVEAVGRLNTSLSGQYKYKGDWDQSLVPTDDFDATVDSTNTYKCYIAGDVRYALKRNSYVFVRGSVINEAYIKSVSYDGTNTTIEANISLGTTNESIKISTVVASGQSGTVAENDTILVFQYSRAILDNMRIVTLKADGSWLAFNNFTPIYTHNSTNHMDVINTTGFENSAIKVNYYLSTIYINATDLYAALGYSTVQDMLENGVVLAFYTTNADPSIGFIYEDTPKVEYFSKWVKFIRNYYASNFAIARRNQYLNFMTNQVYYEGAKPLTALTYKLVYMFKKNSNWYVDKYPLLTDYHHFSYAMLPALQIGDDNVLTLLLYYNELAGDTQNQSIAWDGNFYFQGAEVYRTDAYGNKVLAGGIRIELPYYGIYK